MKVKIFLVVVISIVSIVLMSCSSSNISKEESLRVDTLALVSKDVISLKQYEDFYLKNNVGVNPKDISEESKKEFLDLIIKYRLKINDAYKKGYDKDPIVQQEIKDYEKSLAIPFALDREIVEPNIKTWYERRKENRKIYTIMLRADMNNPSDTLEKYNLINSLLDSLNRGANFKNIATRYTQIGTGQVADSGLLGYVSVGQTVRVFEDAIFSLKPGQYTKVPVRIETGYIVPMLEEIEPRTGGREFSHLLLQFKGANYEDSIRVINLANELKQKLNSGANFEELVKEYSDDPNTKDNGGVLGTFERHPSLERELPSLWRAMFKLKAGEISEPITTELGIHIVKCIKIEPYPSYEDYKPKLRDEYNALRHDEDRKNYVSKLKAQYKFTTNVDVLNEFYHSIDTTDKVSAGKWDSLVTDETKRKTLFTLDNTIKFTVDSIVKAINGSSEFAGFIFNPHRFQFVMDRLSERFVLEHHAKFIPSKYPEFKVVMREYIDGILLYKAEQEAVWNNLVIDDNALKTYYEANKESFSFSDRVEFAEIFVRSDSLAQAIYKQLTDTLAPPTRRGGTPKKIVPPAFEKLVEQYTERVGYKEKQGYWGLCEEKDNMLAIQALERRKVGIYRPLRFENGYSIIKVINFHPPKQKSFEECGPELSTRYQEYETKRLENLWLESMRAEFPVKIFPEKLKEAFSTETK